MFCLALLTGGLRGRVNEPIGRLRCGFRHDRQDNTARTLGDYDTVFGDDAPRQTVPGYRLILVNQKATLGEGPPELIYAYAVAQTVEAGLKGFENGVLNRGTIGNVELILDRDNHMTGPPFDPELARAQA